ncbi:hypothetical protein ETW23_09085 [Leisingera sp. NJS201]|nr:dienelactone hydrolase family protein [Leisingera sp. NJS201]QBR36273.1 hypothetical protein ETW23_09085 [Leisingera sp. NJS201]
MIDIWKETAQKHELILIAPNAKAKNWQPDDFSQTLLDQMLSQQALGRHTGPVYLFGHSNGAIFASMLVNRFEGPWQAAALHGGFASEQVFIPAATPKPVRLYLGERDHIFSSEEAVKTGKAMARSGHSFSLQLIPRHTHWVYEIGPRIAEDSWAWFRSLGE